MTAMPLRQRLHGWWLARLKPRDELTLTQRNVYILPTSAGWMLGLTLLILLVASINYQLNLGYLLTFVLLGNVVVGVHLCHSTLRGMRLTARTMPSVHVGEAQAFDVELHNPSRRPRYSVDISIYDPQTEDDWMHCDVPPHSDLPVQIRFIPTQRGWQPLPLLRLRTLYPLGTFRVWTVWRPAAQVLIYPAAELHPPALPSPQWLPGDADGPAQQASEEVDGVREYRRGDPLKRIVWRKAAKSDQWVSRDQAGASLAPLWLDWSLTGASDNEARISRLTAWVLQADTEGVDYGLRLPGLELPPSHGAVQRQRCLEALALC